jgi:hypothetical protein
LALADAMETIATLRQQNILSQQRVRAMVDENTLLQRQLVDANRQRDEKQREIEKHKSMLEILQKVSFLTNLYRTPTCDLKDV